MTVSCQLCSKEFAAPSHLASHMASKGDHIPCTYSGCMMVFKDTKTMEKHRQQHRSRVLSTMSTPNTNPYLPKLPTWIPFQPPSPYTLSSNPMYTYGSNSVLRYNAVNGTMEVLDHDLRNNRVGQMFNATHQPHQPHQQQILINNGTVAASPATNNQLIKWTVIPTSEYSTAITKLRERTHSNELLHQLGYFRSSEAVPHLFEFAPQASPFYPKRCAVALDCEMVGSRDDKGKEHSVLARLSVVDYLTSNVIIDALVQPDVKVTDWRTRYSGVTLGAMNAAVRSGRALRGTAGARAELWKYVDQETVIVGQSLRNDLDALQMVHLRLVDSGIVTAEAINVGSKSLVALKTTCLELLDIKIQQANRRGHDSVEDSMAAREVVLFCLNEKEKLEKWAQIKRQEHAIAEAKRVLKVTQQRAERRAELDKKISWTKEIWQETPTEEELKAPRVRIPVYRASSDLLECRLNTQLKQYEMLMAPVEESWESTISRSREPLVELPPCHKSNVRVPLSMDLMYKEEMGEELSERRDAEGMFVTQESTDIITEELQNLQTLSTGL